MPWIESDVDLADHPKTIHLGSLLGIGTAQTVGHLTCLWHFTMKFAWRDGDLSDFSLPVISRGAKWEGEPESFIKALQTAGWLDKFKVHDWLDRAGSLVNDRLYNEERRLKSVERRKTALNGVKRRKDGDPSSRGSTAPLLPVVKEHNLTTQSKDLKTKDTAAASPSPVLTDVQKLVVAYKILSGCENDPNWDRVYFKRFSGAAKALLNYLGDYETAVRCMEDVGGKMAGLGRSYTFETIVKHAAEWKKDQAEQMAGRP